MSVFYDKQRTRDLRKFCEETLIKVIAPEVVLVTGMSTCHVASSLIHPSPPIDSI